MLNLLNVLLMAPSGDGKSGGFSSLLFLGLIFVIFYFFMIRPQVKKNKDLRKFRENLKKGDKIVTIGGIHGRILEINEATAIIEVEGQNRLKIEKSAIAMEGKASEDLEKK